MGNKVLYITYDGLLDPLGQSQILPYIKGLSKKGHKFFVISYEKKHRYTNKKNVDKLIRDLKGHNISWHPMRYYRKPYFYAALLGIIRGIVVGAFLIKRENLTIIHARSYVAGAMAYTLNKITKKKVIFDIRGLWVDERADGGLWKKGGLLYGIAKYYERKFFLHSNVIIALTERVKDEIQNFTFMKKNDVPIEVVPTCADLEKFTAQKIDAALIHKYNLKDKFNLIYFGSLGAWYMLEEMIDFFKVLKKKEPNAHLILLINNNLEEAEDMLLSKQVSSDDFTVLFVPYTEVPKWLSITKASIIFYRPCYSLVGRSPTKLGECLACGVPIILNKGIGDSDGIVSVKKVGVIVNSFSKEAYEKSVNELINLLRDKHLKKKLVHTAQEYFSLDKGVEKYFDVYSYLDIPLL